MAGLPSPTGNSVVQAVRSASKRVLGTATVNRKEPISSDLILKIVSQANLDNPVDCETLRCMFCALPAFLDLTTYPELGEVIFPSMKALWSFMCTRVKMTSSVRGTKLSFPSYPALHVQLIAQEVFR